MPGGPGAEATVDAVRTRLLRILLVAAVLVACGPGDGAASDTATAGSPAASASCPEDAGLDQVPPLHPSVDRYPTASVTLISPDGACSITLAVRHADTGPRRQHGLMEVPDLPDGTGMLFTYPDVSGDRTGGYWMKDTLVPLDIAYVAGDGTIVDVVAMDPCDESQLAEGERCPSYPPDAPYRATLEVPQGWFASIGVTEGWRLDAGVELSG